MYGFYYKEEYQYNSSISDDINNYLRSYVTSHEMLSCEPESCEVTNVNM